MQENDSGTGPRECVAASTVLKAKGSWSGYCDTGGVCDSARWSERLCTKSLTEKKR